MAAATGQNSLPPTTPPLNVGEGHVGGGVETDFLFLIQEAPCEVLNQPEDFIAFTLAAGFDLGLLAAPRPGVRERAPLRE